MKPLNRLSNFDGTRLRRSISEKNKNIIGKALEMYPLALALNVADMEAAYFLEGSEK